ncbi:bifunctional 2-C-methyl-D-erythritol 4-phosphate cytidylyltransferase/2-C-methyl-D-erythritol 2,4-cyclodiphosphate synthase [Parasphingorhabdus sp.]|jgi:2-C-methyl-D-erythritol 4-phosphate cytidylyltransferase/2-C-methyl-D-erythritol 2,4-cyclodiphosphate synthase|uniref:bifunctional 2-C-methyl-D-erythritol 4-phosphate cytidylyltransferase/2-C-methyl-D-erythritol 2,4-cyclodiphosphate synthase n=1 Tax=Parasphingorhabdus sp. TaxID=2709688 RepID=UPI003D29747B
MPEPAYRKLETHAIIVAAGAGERTGLQQPKQYIPIAGKPMVMHSIDRLLAHKEIDRLWVVIADGQAELLAQAASDRSDFETVIGGATRQQSVLHGLQAIQTAGGAKNILIHDAARPFLSDDVIDRLLAALSHHDGAIPVLPTVDTTIAVKNDQFDHLIDRNNLWRVQTPQAFDFQKLLAAHEHGTQKQDASDDAQLFQINGHDVAVVEGNEALKKYTLASDFDDVRDRQMMQIRTGLGYDVHRLAPGEELWLGGIKIDHDRGLVGHSDADVLLHALTDALLGCIGAGDIGDHFPPADPQWHGAASRKFVEHAARLIKQRDGIIQNVDMTLICEAPKIKPHRDAIKQNIAELLQLSEDQVSVKATTTEGLGFAGRKEGIAAQAIATISLATKTS